MTLKKEYLRIAACVLVTIVVVQSASLSEPKNPVPDLVLSGEETSGEEAISETNALRADSDSVSSTTLPKEGEQVAGFTVVRLGRIEELGADTILFSHEQSGAELLYIKNDDTNLGFNIGYRTPYVDETDTNHIFEHAIIASSEKYPSTNLFFDLAGKSYHTFVNAYTFPTFTCYPFSTQSEEQYIKMLDVYLSCMAAPDILTNENIYKREALRFELDSKEGPITMHGTVFSEDFGSLTDIQSNAGDDVLNALYPGLTASNSIGRLHRNYKDLTYEKTKATYERCYHFDNSMLFLYGKMDYVKIMEFIDSEYLSNVTRSAVDLSEYTQEEVPAGQVEVRTVSPAYAGDMTEQASVISYAIDLSDASWENLMVWEILAGILNSENSPLLTNAQNAGLTTRVSCHISYYNQKPYILFVVSDTDEEQKDALMEAVEKTLRNITENGIDEKILQPFLKADKIKRYTARNNQEAGIDATTLILNYWVHTGETDIYRLLDECIEAVTHDHSQIMFKLLAARALRPGRSALVVTVPEPGYAEALEAEQEQYLAEMKAAMSEEELEELIRATDEFRAWNENEVRNNDVGINPAGLPDPDEFANYSKVQFDDILSYTAPVQAGHVTAGNLYFDVSEIASEDIYYLPVYQLLLGKLETGSHSAGEVKNLTVQYLSGAAFTELYPGERAGSNARPMTRFSWYCLTEDYENSMELLIEVMGTSDFSDIDHIKTILNRYLPYYDQSRYGNRLGQAHNQALGYVDRSTAFANAVGGQDLYWFMKEVVRRLEEEPEYAAEFTAKMNQISTSLLNCRGMIIMNAAAADDLEQIQQTAVKHLAELPSRQRRPVDYLDFIAASQKTGICVEDSMQYNVLVADMGDLDRISGKDLVYLTAAGDKYITPVLRFRNGAYSAGSNFSNPKNICYVYTYSDPNIGSTLDAFGSMAEYLETVAISQEELNGYILNAYAAASAPLGVFDRQILAMTNDVNGLDMRAVAERMNQIKAVTLDDQPAAAKALGLVFGEGAAATVGNQRKIEEAKDSFDVIRNYKVPY